MDVVPPGSEDDWKYPPLSATIKRKRFIYGRGAAGSIGKRYRRQDELGTPFCITIDYESLENNTITLRDRDTMQQIRIEIQKVPEIYIGKLSNFIS